MTAPQSPGPHEIVRFACPQCGKVHRARKPSKPTCYVCSSCQTRFRFDGARTTLADARAAPAKAPSRSSPRPPRARADRKAGRATLAWILGGAAAVVLLGVVGFFGFRAMWGGRNPALPDGIAQGSGDKEAAPEETKSDRPREAVADAVAKKLKLTASLVRDSRDQQNFNSRTTYLVWRLKLQLENQSTVPLNLGPNLLLYELNAASSFLEGVGVFLSDSATSSNASYGLFNNWEANGSRYTVSGNNISFSYGGGGRNFGSVQPGTTRSLDRSLEQGTWMRDDLRVKLLVVLPEIRAASSQGVERFRLLAYFTKDPASSSWTLESQKVISLDPKTLQGELESPESSLLKRVLAANFLAEAHPKVAVAPLVRVAQGMTEGDLLASCIDLLIALKGPGLGQHAQSLLERTTLPNGIRSRAARYLGVIKHDPAWELLVRSARESDRTIASAALNALGDFGGDRAVDVLLAMLETKENSDHRLVASNLAHTKMPKAIEALKDHATRGSSDALNALVDAKLPDTFEFFVQLAKDAGDATKRGAVARGLRQTGREKAIPALLDMLERAGPGQEYSDDELVRAVAELDQPTATPKLAALAKAGNLLAARVLERSRNESVREPLTDLATQSNALLARIALRGLAEHWSTTSREVFVKLSSSADAELARSAKNALERAEKVALAEAKIKSAKAIPLTVGKKATGSLTGGNKEVVYEVTLVTGTSYIIDMISADTRKLDPYLKVANPSGTVVAENDDGGEGLNSRIRLQPLVGGAHRIVATHFGSADQGEFTLEIRKE